ncbi:MAG: nucleotidyltransferase domain-containing protein [Patescibacteria group bacterium]|nr:nucleotidyltransferase domain-containing protein [Patescibacteria group bacterium]
MAKKATLPKKIKKEVLNYIKLLKRDNFPIKEVFVFGSQIKRETHKWSDIDVCIISPKFKDPFKAMHYLLLKSYEINAIIEPHLYHPKDFVPEDPLVWEIKKTGIKIS